MNTYLPILSMLTMLSVPAIASGIVKNTPPQACNAMAAVGLQTKGWNNRYEDSYGCSSPYKDIGNGYPMPNNLAFYAEGNKSKVNKVKIILNFNDRTNTKAAYKELNRAAAIFIKEFTGSDMPLPIQAAISSNKNLTISINNSMVSVEKIDWPNGGYEIQVSIH